MVGHYRTSIIITEICYFHIYIYIYIYISIFIVGCSMSIYMITSVLSFQTEEFRAVQRAVHLETEAER